MLHSADIDAECTTAPSAAAAAREAGAVRREVEPGPSSGAISATEPDWSRERCERWWDPPKRLLKSIRGYQRWAAKGGLGRRLICPGYVLAYRFWSVVCGADIPLSVRLGGGLLITHPNGIVIHGHASVGPNCLIFQQVTIGGGGKKPGIPRIGGHVDIGAGAKILGGVVIGDHARIGANAVVLDDVPPGATAVGIPARISPRGQRSDPQSLTQA